MMMHTAHRPPPLRHSSRAFTLVELLVVLVVILILVTLVVGVGSAVLRNQKVTATKGVLSALDRSLEEYIAERGDIPKYDAEQYIGTPGPTLSTSGGGVWPWSTDPTGPEDYKGVDHVRRPVTSVFLEQTSGFGAIDEIIGGVSPDFIFQSVVSYPDGSGSYETRPAPVLADSWANDDWSYIAPRNQSASGCPMGDPVFDNNDDCTPDWDIIGPNGNQLIYYVHPSNRLAQDLFGKCRNNRPYFMSAGPDKLYGLGGDYQDVGEITDEELGEALDDNIYSYEPEPVDLDDTINLRREPK